MALNPAQLAHLSRLLDEALALPFQQRADWLASLPSEAQPLRARLARAILEEHPGEEAPRFDAPQLPADADEDGRDGRVGEQIGPWRLLQLLGRGGMGCVWAAERADGLYERKVALKLPRMARSASMKERLLRESQIAARLEHPGIARLYDAGIDGAGRPYLVMERVDGTGLAEHAQALGLGLEGRLQLTLQVADALAYAHRLLVVHRDIKPSNLLVNPDGQVKLLDFGVARLLDDDLGGASATLSSSALTHTPRYAAPEQRIGAPVGTATDLYALALVLHELLTGTLPTEVGQGQAGPLPDQQLPPALRAVLVRAWQIDPALRQPSVAHFADELRAVLGHRVPISWTASPAQRLGLWSRRHRLALWWGGLALVGLMAAAGSVLLEQARTREQQERLDQARIFLTTTFADTEPRAQQPADAVTGLDLIESALQRARTELAGQPVLQAEVMGELAVMLRRFARPDEALAVLRQAHRQMQDHAPQRDAGRQLVAAQRALQELADWQQHGHEDSLTQAQTLAQQVLQGCSAQSVRCAKARAFAQAALRNRAAALGEDEPAQAAAAQAVAESTAAFGAGHAETVMAQTHLALVLRNAHRLAAADQALQAARAGAPAAGLRRGDANELKMVQATIDGDFGRHDQALTALDELLHALSPQAPDLALLQRLRAQSLWSQGRLALAVAACEAALQSAIDQGDHWERLNALHLRTRALAALGRLSQAELSLAEWDEQMKTQPQPANGLQALRWQRGRADVALRDGRLREASSMALALTNNQTGEAPPSLQMEWAMNWDMRGATARAAGEAAQAVQFHQQAHALYAQRLPPAHPLVLRNRLEAARAAALAAPGPDADAALREAAQRYLHVLPADSAWRPAVQALAAGQAAPPPGLL